MEDPIRKDVGKNLVLRHFVWIENNYPVEKLQRQRD
jgi:hypothetical protein